MVVALMAEASARPVKTFSIGFPDAADSELQYARLIAKRFGTEHHEEIVTPDVSAALVETVRHHGQPFGDSSAVATYYLSKMTRQHVTVALSGDGSDECFAGYKRYTQARLGYLHDALSPVARGAMRAALGTAARLVKPSLASFGDTLALPEGERYMRLVGQLGDGEKRTLYLAPMQAALHRDRSFDAILAASRAATSMGRICDLDFQTYLEGDINPKVDIASMTHALEVRCPFLDTAVVELASRLPAHMLMRVRGKHVLRRAARRLLPARTRWRIKQGFALPLERWMQRDLRDMTRDLLFDRRCRERGLFEPKAVRDLVARMEAGRGSADHVWTLLVLELWFRELVDPISA
jgi:asparagine synthase (glutamine-hydrolysing)